MKQLKDDVILFIFIILSFEAVLLVAAGLLVFNVFMLQKVIDYFI